MQGAFNPVHPQSHQHIRQQLQPGHLLSTISFLSATGSTQPAPSKWWDGGLLTAACPGSTALVGQGMPAGYHFAFGCWNAAGMCPGTRFTTWGSTKQTKGGKQRERRGSNIWFCTFFKRRITSVGKEKYLIWGFQESNYIFISCTKLAHSPTGPNPIPAEVTCQRLALRLWCKSILYIKTHSAKLPNRSICNEYLSA